MMEKEYVYTVVREDFKTGERAKRTRKYYSFTPRLEVGGLYAPRLRHADQIHQ